MTAHTVTAPAGAISDATFATAAAQPTADTMLSTDTTMTMVNDGNTYLVFHAGAATTIVFTGQRGASSTGSLSLTSGKTYTFGPFDQGRFNDKSGNLSATLGTGSASHTCYAQTITSSGKTGSLHNPFTTSNTASSA